MAKKIVSVSLDLVEGVEGQCIYLNDRRIAGPKPWGGGKIVKQWKVRVDAIYEAIREVGEKRGRK